MDENTEAQEMGNDDDGNSLIKDLRKQLSKAQAEAKRLAEENQLFQETRAQSRASAVEAAVNGKNYPDSIVAALTAQVETASDEEFEKLLQDLGTPGEGSEGVQEAEAAKPQATPSPGEIGQRVAAAASGGAKEVDVAKEIAATQTRAELHAVVAKHGLDRF
ncbi:hypothetical protein [Porticoccus sp.]